MTAPRVAGRGTAYVVDPWEQSRETLLCQSCGTTLSNCDWFPDALGRLSLRCPNAHRHGTGWTARPAPDRAAPRWRVCAYPGCGDEFAYEPTRGGAPKYCADHRAIMQKQWNNERKTPRKPRQSKTEYWREYWQKKAIP